MMVEGITRRQHAASIFTLCVCMLAHSYLLISVFPYSGFMAMSLIPSLNEENVGSYAGLISSAFMVGRAVSAYAWGVAADVYGRKLALHVSLGLSGLFSVMFGLSTSFYLALLWRFMLGLSNGMNIVTKVLGSELAFGDKELETWGVGLIMSMWAWGIMIAPAISGALADPANQYPGWEWSKQPVWVEFPFLLPNVIAFLMCSIAMLGVHIFVFETMPHSKYHEWRNPIEDARSTLRRWCRRISSSLHTLMRDDEKDSLVVKGAADNSQYESVPLTATLEHGESTTSGCKSKSTPTEISSESLGCEDVESATVSSLWANVKLRNLLWIYWSFSFLQIAFDEAFPLFCIARQGGLGLSALTIGKVISVSGILFIPLQYIVHTIFQRLLGVEGSVLLGMLVVGPLTFLTPLSIALNNSGHRPDSTSLTISSFWFLAVLLSFIRVLGFLSFASITVALNRAVDPLHRGKMNGLSAFGGSIAKAAGPAFAGILVSFSFSSGVFSRYGGAVFMFILIGASELLAAFATFGLLKSDD